jgi:imidazolonepropionase-like amidohydrolase
LNQLSKAITEDKVLLRGARQLLTLQDSANPRRGRSLGELSIIPDGAVLFGGGAIIEVGTSRRVENLKGARGAREIDATGRVVMPGFVDAAVQLIHVQPHLEAYECMLRGGAKSQAEEGIQTLRAASARRLEDQVRKLIERLVRHGTTTIGSKSGSSEPAENLKMIRVLSRLNRRPLEIVTSCFGANHIPPESTIAVLAPASVLYHEPRSFTSARALIDSGVAVALASGFGPDSSPTYNMQTVISLACLEMHMTPAEAICAATVNAAHALQCAERLGCLDTGKQADLVMLNIEDYRELPYYFGTNHVHLVVKNGRTIYHEGKVSL